MRRLTYKLHGCALSTETKACVPLISMALPMALIAFHGKDKRFTEPCLRFARALQLDFFPLFVQPATGEFNEPALLDFSLGSGSPCCRAIKRTKVVWNVLATSLSNGTPLCVR